MNAKTDVLLQQQLGNATFSRSASCLSNRCLVQSFADSPSISWVSLSPHSTDGQIVVESKWLGWQQRGPTRVDWPWAVGLWRRPTETSAHALFTYNLAERTYKTYDIPDEAMLTMFLGRARAVVVLRESFLVMQLDEEDEVTVLPAKPLQYILPNICFSRPRELLLASMNDLQIWKFKNLSDGPGLKVALQFTAQIGGVGYTDIAWHGTTVATVSGSGSLLRVMDTTDAAGDEVCDFHQKIPITKLFLDEEYLITGHSDGTIRVLGADRMNFITQLNLSPLAIRPIAPSSSSAIVSMLFKISYLHRMGDYVISSALERDSRQLEISIWALKGSHSVYPLKSRIVLGNVLSLHFDEEQQVISAVVQSNPSKDTESLTFSRIKIDTKALGISLSKWKSNNEADQDKLAMEMLSEILISPSFHRALMKISLPAERVEIVAEAIYNALKDEASVLKELVECALNQELELFHPDALGFGISSALHKKKNSNGLESVRHPKSASPSPRERSTSSSTTKSDDSLEYTKIPELTEMQSSYSASSSPATSISSLGTGSSPFSTSHRRAYSDEQLSSSSLDHASTGYWSIGSLTSTLISQFLVNRCHRYNFVALSDPITLLAKSSKFVFSISGLEDSETYMSSLKRLTKIVTSIIDNIIAKDSHLPQQAVDLLSEYHQRLRVQRPDLTELRSMKVGAGRIFITHFILAAWLDPVKFGLASKPPTDLGNLYTVAQLLEAVCLGSSSELTGDYLVNFRTEQTKKFRTWLLAKLQNPQEHAENIKKKSVSSALPRASGAGKITFARGATLLMAQCMIAHHDDLILAMTPEPSTPKSPTSTDATIELVKTLSHALLRPIQTIMTKEAQKDPILAEKLDAFSDNHSSPSHKSSPYSSASSSSSTMAFRLDLDERRYGRSPRSGSNTSSPFRRRAGVMTDSLVSTKATTMEAPASSRRRTGRVAVNRKQLDTPSGHSRAKTRHGSSPKRPRDHAITTAYSVADLPDFLANSDASKLSVPRILQDTRSEEQY